jgi:hypothetical protein
MMWQDQLIQAVRERIRAVIGDLGPPPFPFIATINIHQMMDRLELEVRITFNDGRPTRFTFPLRLFDRMGIPRVSMTDISQVIIAMIEDVYIEEADRAHPGMIMLVQQRVMWQGYWTDGEIAPGEMLHMPWRSAAEEDQRRRQNERRAARDQIQRGPHYWAEQAAPLRHVPALVTPGRFQPYAEARGRKLLLENMTEEQRFQYLATGSFPVKGCNSGQSYIIYHGTHMNIMRGTHCVCLVPTDRGLPMVAGDILLTQKLGLELEENAVMKEANLFYHISHGMLSTFAGEEFRAETKRIEAYEAKQTGGIAKKIKDVAAAVFPAPRAVR